MEGWKPPSKAKALLAIAVPLAAVTIFSVKLADLGIGKYWRLFGGDAKFAGSQILMALAFAFWIRRYTLPSVKLLAKRN